MPRCAEGDIAITGYKGYLGSLLVSAVRNMYGVDPILIDKARIPEITSEVVIHLGEPSSVASCELATVESCYRNIESIALNPNVATVIYASSALLYDRKDVFEGGWPESARILVDNNYKLIKANSERRLAESGKTFVVLRLSNVLGYSAKKANLLADIFRQIDNETRLVELRDLTPVNDFIGNRDVISAMLHCVNLGYSGIFNCGTGEGLSVADLCDHIFRTLGRTDLMAVATVSEHDINDETHFSLNVNKLTRTGWRPSMTLDRCIESEWTKFLLDVGL